MEVNFDLVRIGRTRKNYTSEKILEQNVDLLKSNIRFFLKEKVSNNKNNVISMVMVVPGKGYNIKIALQDIRDNEIKKELKKKFPNSIYKGEYSTLLDNMNNRVFR